MVISLTSCLLNLLSIHYPDQPYGLAILKTLFLPQWYQRLNTHLHGSHSESILVTMKLYTAMSNFAGGRERKAVMEVFAWDNKVAKLLNMRRRGRGEIKGILSRPGECHCQSPCHRDFTTIDRYQNALRPLRSILCRHNNPHQLEDGVHGAAQRVIGRNLQGLEPGPLPSGPAGS